DAGHVRGIWRRATLASYATGHPRWDTILDIDALSRAENANWVFEGANCEPSGARCMISLSNGGLDAVTQREFDVESKSFVDGGFVGPEAKSNVAWLARDVLLVATDYGSGTLTQSGYPFVLKAWRRGTSFSSATEIQRGQASDVSIAPFTLDDVDGTHVTFS